MAQAEINFEKGARTTPWSEELELVPLKQRLKLLLASHRATVDSDVKLERNPVEDVAEKMGGEQYDSQLGCSEDEKMVEATLTEEKHNENTGELGVSNREEDLARECLNSGHTIDATAATPEKDSVHSSCQGLLLGKLPGPVKVEYADNDVQRPNAMYGSTVAEIPAVNTDLEMSQELLDELDHVVLKERLRRLLKSKCLGLAPVKLEEHPSETGKEERRFASQWHAVSGNPTLRYSSLQSIRGSSKPPQVSSHCPQGNRSAYTDSLRIHRNDEDPSSESECLYYEPDKRKNLVSAGVRTAQGADLPNLAKVKIEPPNCNEMQACNMSTVGLMSFSNLVLVKTEVEPASGADELDHMLLRERMKLLPSREDHSLNSHQNSECISRMLPSAFGSTPVLSKPTQLLKVNRPRKKRKTATDSVETAMEEDAPGLLKVLTEKGVSVDEIKLYGEPESDDTLDDSSTNDNFADLEAVIGKLFSQRVSLLKFAPLRCYKGEKASYCLECLFSLVEQARYLQFRNWPVEWGWCRDLQSFIFVFERHNRIVLERPEYGYATYFFELEDSLPINWQIKRLVIAMKLTSCSRITLIENKALMIGDDLTEGEARVLMEYGWAPNTGLGTMLNYYDRVVHDRKSETDSSEWRSKIGKLLVDGYNCGTMASAGIPIKDMEYNHPVEIKLELS